MFCGVFSFVEDYMEKDNLKCPEQSCMIIKNIFLDIIIIEHYHVVEKEQNAFIVERFFRKVGLKKNMKVNYTENINNNEKDKVRIGNVIEKERKDLDLTQSELSEKLYGSGESRQTISKFERGKQLPPLEKMLMMCNIFQCEIEYLLGIQKSKFKEDTDIEQITGLSVKSINTLKNVNYSERKSIIQALNKILEHEKAIDLLEDIYTHFCNFEQNMLRSKNDRVYALAEALECTPDKAIQYLEESSKSLIISELLEILKISKPQPLQQKSLITDSKKTSDSE